MKRVKLISTLLAALMVSGSLIGCSSGTTAASSSDKSTGASAADSSKSGAKASGNLVIYTGAGDEITGPILAEFKKEYPGISTKIVKAGTGEVLARIKAENGNPGGDVMLGGTPTTFETNSTLFEAYEAKTDNDMKTKDPNHIWHAYAANPQTIVVNTNLMKDASKYPKSLKDLSDPKWKSIGKIAFCDPSKSGTALTIVSCMITKYDWNYVTDLLKDAEVYSSSDSMFNAVKDGTNPIGFINEDLGTKWQQSGVPIKMIYPEDGVTNSYDALAIIKNAKDMDNAKIFVDYFGSKTNHEILKDKILKRSTRSDVEAPNGLPNIPNLLLAKSQPDEAVKTGFNDAVNKARK